MLGMVIGPTLTASNFRKPSILTSAVYFGSVKLSRTKVPSVALNGRLAGT